MKFKERKNISFVCFQKSRATDFSKPLLFMGFSLLLCSEQHTFVCNKKVTKPLFLINAFPLDKFYFTIYNGMV